MNNQNNAGDNGMVLVGIIFIAIFFGIPMLYAANSTLVNRFFLDLSSVELRFFAHFSTSAAAALEKVNAADPAALTWEQISKITSYTGSWIRWPFALILGLCAFVGFNLGRVEKLLRRLNMKTLIQHNVEMFPCLCPILGRGEYLLSPASYDAGHWQIARSPLQFALVNELLLAPDGTPYQMEEILHKGMADEGSDALGKSSFDHARAKVVFGLQLGDAFSGVETLSPERRAVAAAFMAYAQGNKQAAVDLLDMISLTYSEAIPGAKKNKADTPPAALQKPSVKIPEYRVVELLEKHKGLLESRELQRHAAFQLPWFVALLNKARSKGVLACSQMLWIRPIDRSLWSALSQTGGRTAWAEGYATWSHHLAEEKNKKAIKTPQIEGAVKGLFKSLDAQGWFAASAADLATGAASSPYDAENDPSLADGFE